MKFVRWSLQDTLLFAAAVPVAGLVGRTIVALAPMMAVASGAMTWKRSIHDRVTDFVSYGSIAYEFAMASVGSLPTILFCIIIVALLGATNSRFGICTGALIPIAIVMWSYYCLRDVWMNTPIIIALLPEYLALYLGRRTTAGQSPNSQSMLLLRFAAYLFIVVLAVTSEIWWRRYWTPNL